MINNKTHIVWILSLTARKADKKKWPELKAVTRDDEMIFITTTDQTEVISPSLLSVTNKVKWTFSRSSCADAALWCCRSGSVCRIRARLWTSVWELSWLVPLPLPARLPAQRWRQNMRRSETKSNTSSFKLLCSFSIGHFVNNISSALDSLNNVYFLFKLHIDLVIFQGWRPCNSTIKHWIEKPH